MNGKRIAHYEVTGRIGAGGMGEVYRAHDTKLGRDVALKILPEAFAQDADRLSRFEREARMLASLNHPNIAAIYGIERDGDRRVLVLELVEGDELSQVIERGPMPLKDTLRVAEQVADAVETAHEQGVIHRDLKPANIKFTPSGTVKVLDFGLAKALDTGGGGSNHDLSHSPTILHSSPTVQGVILGTAAYMSPEQARGKVVDRRADVWAFGCVVYEMLTGRVAFPGETVTDTLAKILEREPDWEALPATVSPALRYVLEKCLAKDVSERWRSVGDVAMMMRRTAESRGMGETAPSPAARGRARWLWPAIAGFFAVIAAGALLTRGAGRGTELRVGGPPAMTFDRLTVQGGVEGNVCVSPDGNFIVYNARDDGDWDIFFQRIPGGRPINLTANSANNDGFPAISPDGQRIAFNSNRDGGGLYVMGATGESVRRIGEGLWMPSWAPDGRRVVASSVSFDNPLSRGSKGDLWIVGVDDNERKQLTSGIDAVQPDWSPNGHRVAFWGIQDTTGGQRDLRTVGVEGGDVVAVTSDPPVDWSPVWSPDGRYLYFVSDRGGSFNLWRVPIDERTGETRGEPEPMTTPTENVGSFDVSADGRRIIYPATSFRSNIYRVDFDPDGDAPPREVQVTRGSTEIINFDISQDGEWLVYRSGGHREDLYICRSDGSEVRKLTDDMYRDRGPSWSYDGETIYFYSDRSGRYEFWSIRNDGSGLTQLTETVENSWWFPKASPDGTRLLGHNEDGSVILDIGDAPVNPASGTMLPPVGDGLVPRMWAWSPDGTRLAGRAITRGEGDVAGALIYVFETGTYRRLAESLGEPVSWVDWLSDGRRLLGMTREALVLIDTDTGETRTVMRTGAGEYEVHTASDNAACFIRYDAEADIWMATMETP